MRIDVKHIAELAKLEIEENRLEEFERDMISITEIADRFPDVEDAELLSGDIEMQLREDSVILSGITRAEILSAAPEQQSGYITIPKTV